MGHYPCNPTTWRQRQEDPYQSSMRPTWFTQQIPGQCLHKNILSKVKPKEREGGQVGDGGSHFEIPTLEAKAEVKK